jgi:outer membrane lipoprotein-sorting protein
MILALSLLGGCASQSDRSEELALSLRTSYLSLSHVSAQAEVTADYGDSVFTYEVQVEGNQLGGSLTVLQPEEVAGITVTWQEGETTLIYDGASVETGSLSPDGLSPTDGIPLLLEALRTGPITSATLENWDTEELLVITLDNPNYTESGTSWLTVWADAEDFTLRRAEIAWEGETVIQMEFEEFSYE